MRLISYWLCLSAILITGCEGIGARRSMSSDDEGARAPVIGEKKKGRSDSDYVRMQGRGHLLEPEHDPLKKFIHSETALEIERNLGIGE